LFIYHSGDEKAIIGTGTVLKEAYPDPKAKEWVVVEIGVGKKLKKPVTLSTIKATKKLATMVLVRASRLSVQPVHGRVSSI
jgi:predicted RNA-binding protein with PUA-like domain